MTLFLWVILIWSKVFIVYSVDIEKQNQKEAIQYKNKRIIVSNSVYDDGRNR